MSRLPQVRIWGIVDLFLLLAVVLMIARVDAIAAAEEGQDELSLLKADVATLKASLESSVAKNRQLSRNMDSSKSALEGSNAELAEALRKAEQELRLTKSERDSLREAKLELERENRNLEEAIEGDFSAEEHIERYKRLKGMVDIIEVTLSKDTITKIDQLSFPEERFRLYKKVPDEDPESDDLVSVLAPEKLSAFVATLQQHIQSKERGRALIMLGYDQRPGTGTENDVRAAVVAMAKDLANSASPREVTISLWFKRK